ncbi:MAG: IS66 family transposase [Humibacillus sp.]|nr:IS66 family transposase [Humibacillus sp.]
MPAASLEDVLATMARLQARVTELEAENAELRAENAELRRRVGLDSGNSSKPPSSDGPDKAPPTSLRKKTGRKPGGQPGRAGSRLEQVADPDQMVVHRPGVCAGCAGTLHPDAPVVGAPVIRQVFDLPQIVVEVTEHQMLAVTCGCGHTTRAAAPERAAGPTNLGDGISAVAVYLSTCQMIPIERVADTIEALFGIEVSSGWVSLALARAEEALEPANEAIKTQISGSGTAFFDESMTRVCGKQAWFHTAATDTLTAYHADASGRGLAAMTAFGILKAFTGVAVHDAYSAYYSDTLNQEGLTHALCVVHIQRELRGLVEHDLAAAKDGWAAGLDELIENLFRWRQAWRDDGHEQLPPFKHAKITREWDTLLERALAVHPHQPGRPGGQTHARRLAVRLRDRKQDYLRWLSNFAIPPTNNTAEQSVRMIKTKTKTSGGFRTLAGLQQFLTIRGYLDTLRKNQRHIITELRHALQGNAWVPA